MSFPGSGLEKAAALCLGVITASTGLPAGAAETTIGAAGLIDLFLDRNKKLGPECERARARIQSRVRAAYQHKISGSDGNWQADADLLAADIALSECLEAYFIDRAQLAEAAVSPKGFCKQAVEMILDNLGRQRPDLFARAHKNKLTYQYARDVISAGIEEAFKSEKYFRSLEPQIVWEMAQVSGKTLEGIEEIKTGLKLQDEYLREIKFLEQSLNASKEDLIGLLGLILERPVRRENILPELEAAYGRLKELRDNFDDLKRLSNDAPEISSILAAANAALQAGDNFSLGKADEELAAADRQYQEIIAERAAQQQNGELNRSKILTKRGKIAEVRFRYSEAEALFREALEIEKRVLGEDHPDTATSYNNLASNLNAQGQYRQAAPLFHKALEICERVLGPDHPSTATSYNNVAYNLHMQGRFAEAEPLFRKALEIFERKLGPDHPDTVTSYNNLAGNLNAQGRFAEAEPLLRKALEIWERVLGPDHPSTVTGYNNLAVNLDAQGRFAEAEPLLRKALETRKQVLGEDHPSTVNSYNNVAYNLHVQGRFAEAEPLFRKALEIFERKLGPTHPSTADSYNNLAVNLNAQGRFAEAEPLFRKALEIRERVLGPDHPSTATSYNNLAYYLNAQGRYGEAEPLYRKALEIRESVLGEDHPNTCTVRYKLADNLNAR